MNIFRQAHQLITTKTCGEFTSEDINLINQAIFPAINLLPRLEPEYDEMPVSEGLKRLAELIDGKTLIWEE